MQEDRTVRSDGHWDEEFERSGGQARPFFVSDEPLIADAIELAITAGAARIAARAAPENRMVWLSFADAKSRQAREKVTAWLATQSGG